MKTPKTESSVRKVFLPRSVAEELIAWKAQQEEVKDILQEEYQDYGLILATEYGLPRGGAYIRDSLNKLIKQHDLPQIVFHSFRHMSVTYKLKLNGGDIKAVQGDSDIRTAPWKSIFSSKDKAIVLVFFLQNILYLLLLCFPCNQFFSYAPG